MAPWAPLLLFVATLLPAALLPMDESGFPKTVAAHKGKVVLYNFWATYCLPCRKEMPDMLKLQTKLAARGFELVLISADEPEQEATAEKILKQNGAKGMLYRKTPKNDEAFINAIDPQWSGALPASFLYDRKGHKARSFIGEADMKALEAAILKLL